MAAILGLGPEEVASLCREALPIGHVEPVNFNCPDKLLLPVIKKLWMKPAAWLKRKGQNSYALG